MIEQRGLPLSTVMATVTARIPLLGELLPVNILVAVLALSRGCLEIHVRQLGFQIGWLVAIRARRCTMRPNQRERRLGVIEPRQFLPRLGGVARLAAGRLSILTGLPHALLELAFVRIGVAGSAIHILPVVNGGWLLAQLR